MKLKILTRKINRLLFFLFILISFLSVGNETFETSRTFNEEAISVYEESGDFSYMNLKVRPPSIWQRLQWWFANMVAKIFSNPNAPWLSDLVFYGLLILVLGIAIFYILKLKYGGGFASDSHSFHAGNVSSIQAVSQIDFDRLIEEAVKSGDFKLAIRYVYLKSLAFLSDKQIIKLKEWKSPYDYEKELQKELVPMYRDLSQLFEYVWYGDFNAKETDVNKGAELLLRMEEVAK